MTATKQLTVAELIAKLEKRDPNLPVLIEGCDCYGDAAGTAHFPKSKTWNNPSAILITRTDSNEYTQDDDDRHHE
jgi:hypothetical protein